MNRINSMREKFIETISEKYPNLARKLEEERYFIASIKFENQGGIFTIVDFTSRQEEHLDDLGEYSKKLYKNFIGGNFFC